ncbi:SDR family NAD(P)-dependent oxidoreductase [Dapis sp. BLCC M126]|uniref:type I polyketide synthase n=1 Tax=Dapis sp. BLCC M126 TaxID=3400189 RepID=UPI003CF9BA1C
MNEINELDIAIIGLSGRFPKAKDIDSFWQNLKDGVESISVFSEQELLDLGISSNLLKNPNYVKARPVISDIEMFDANFFGFSAKEAEDIDPQQRLFLESAWEVIESAGYDSEKYRGAIGVYAGIGLNTYLLNNVYPNYDSEDFVGGYKLMITSDKDFLPTRVSYKLNLRGPAVNVQTACSTSLVAVHLACQSLLNGECNMALAGGVSIMVPQNTGYLYTEGMILSPDGHCRAFDAQAKGTIPGSGLGIVLLKRLEDAIEDRDSIYAVIKGSAINNDGSVKVGYTAPSTEGQAAVIAQAQDVAEVDAESITYIEAHGTATTLGDPIEIAALTRAFRKSTQKQNFCAIGSLKSNMGHLDAAAGVGGLIKTVLALKHKLIPPSLHFEEPSPQIDFANSPFYVNTTLSEWKSNGSPRRAGVSSFGIGGTNAHVILEETPELPPSGESRGKHLLLISAKTSSALDQATANLAKHITENPDLNLADAAYTLSCGRRAFSYRRMLVCQSATEAVQELTNLDSQQVFTKNVSESTDRPVVFMFPGQGSQYVNMALEVYETESVFREQVDLCSEILKPELGLDLRQILYPQPDATQTAQEKLQQTAIAQVAIFVIEYALAKLWQSWGISPKAAIGHSIGEYVAATLAEVFSLETALSLVAARGKMMQQLPTGGMLSIPLSSEELQPLLTEKLAIAAINESSRCVVSGDTESIEILENKLAAKNIECRRLHTSHAFHSQMMEPILNDFRDRVKQESLKPPQIPYISNLTGDWITESQATDPNYWVQHLRQTVLFAKGLENLLQSPEQILLEVGPGRTLTSLTKRHPSINQEQLVLTSVRHPQEDKSDVAFLLTSVGNLWLAGVEVNWNAFYSQEDRYRVPLPTYPFERQRYWISPPKPGENTKLKQQVAGKKSDISQWFYIPSWKRLPLPPSQAEKSLGNILLFIDESGLGEKLATQLTQLSEKVICVKVGDSFMKDSQGIYTLNPTQPDDYNTLLDELVSSNLIPEKVIHLWSLTTEKLTKELDADLFDKAQDLGFYSLLFFAQACGKQLLAEQCEIFVVSNNMQDVTGNEILSPEKSTILGPVKVISQEYFNFSCRCIDVALPDIGSKQEKILIEHLITELTATSSAQIIAYRGKSRWVENFELFPLKSQTKSPQQKLKEQGVYLITGGLGGIGIVLAEFLAKTVQAKLILIGRSTFPERDNWSEWVKSHDEQDSISQKIQKLQEFETYGAEVLVLSADVSDFQKMELVIEKAEKKFGKINGVIHAAGMVTGNSINAIQNIGKAECQPQFMSKIYGTLVLGKLLKDREIDFCLLMSSISSILGGLGFVAYTASNSFMDYFVQADNHLENNSPWISVNWDGWKVGSESKQNLSFGKNLAELLITPEEGTKAFEVILSESNTNQLVVSTGDLEARINQWVKRERVKKESNLEQLVDSEKDSSINLGTVYVAPRNQQEEILVEIFQSVLGGNKVGINDDFFELGGDSLVATMLIAKIKQNFTVDINIGEIFNLTTVANFSEYINSQKETIDSDLEKINQMLELVESTIDD